MEIKDIKIGDVVLVKKNTEHGSIGMLNISRELEFNGRVTEIRGQILILDNPAAVHIKNVVGII